MLDIMSVTKTIWMEACSNNRQGYDVMYAMDRPSRFGRSQDGEGLGLQDRSIRWRGYSTRFHRPNVVSCEIVWKVQDVEAG